MREKTYFRPSCFLQEVFSRSWVMDVASHISLENSYVKLTSECIYGMPQVSATVFFQFSASWTLQFMALQNLQ